MGKLGRKSPYAGITRIRFEGSAFWGPLSPVHPSSPLSLINIIAPPPRAINRATCLIKTVTEGEIDSS